MFVFKERGTSKRKLVPLPDLRVRKNEAMQPESNADVRDTILSSLLPGAVVGADGGLAIGRSVAKCHAGAVPLATAIHGRRPRKQFTRLVKMQKKDVAKPLLDVLEKQGIHPSKKQ